MRCKGNVEHIGEKRNVHKFLHGKPEAKTSLGRSRYRWDSIKKCTLKKDGLDQFVSERRPVVGTCEHGKEPSGSIRCWDFLTNFAFRKGLAPWSSVL
jgi:hypothetical protein